MRIYDGGNRNAWREPDDGDVITRPQPAAYAPTPEPEAAAPAPAPTPPFWAAGTPVPPNVLDSLPPAGVQPPPEPEPAAAPAAPTPTPTPATALATPPTGYTGERPADPTWLAARETALVAVRSDYQAALAQAQANPGALGNVNPGWIPATLVTDESGQTHSASNAALVQFSDPNAAAVITGWNEGSPIYGQPAGPTCEFNEAAFAASYQAQAAKQAGSPLQALATLYDSPDATTLFAQHPELWHIATHDHAIDAGPAKAGFAMGNASQLGMSDLYLADPQINALVNAYGGSVAPATGGIALEQVRLYGQQRYDQLSRLGNAMQSVRDQYGSALTQAFTSNTGPGWTERARTVTFSDESGAQTTRPVYLTDEGGGQHQTITDRVFDPDAFTAWYVKQPGLQNKAFGDFYGTSHTQYANDESGRAIASGISFDNAHWSMGGVGSPMGHRELVGINPNDPPELNDNAAVGFDFEAGWATQRSNLHQDTDWFETAFKVVVIAAVAYFSAGTLGPAVAGAMGMSTAAAGAVVTAADLTIGGMIVSAAVVGAATSVASGILNDNLSLKGVLRGALSGALTAGLMQGVGDVLQSAGAVTTVGGVSTLSTVGSIAARTTVQGAVQALMGGNFKDGAIAGLASGLADAAAGHLNAGIDQAVLDKTMTAAEGFAAHSFARVIGSAIRAAASPGDPGQAFASAFLDDVFRQVGPPGAGQQLNPTVDAGGAPIATTPEPPVPGVDGQAPAVEGTNLAGNPATVIPPSDPFSTIRDDAELTRRELLAEQLGVPVESIVDVGLRDYAGRSTDVFLGFIEGAGFSALATGEALVEIAKSPRQFIDGVKTLLTSPEARAQFGNEIVMRVKVDLQMLEDAFNSGDMRGTGQQLGKLTTDLAQVAGGVEALARLGVSAGSAGGRLLLGAVDELANASLLKVPSLFDAAGKPLMDFRALTNAQKGVVGETLGASLVKEVLPDGQRLGRAPMIGQTGIDDLYKVARPDVDFVMVEYKFGSSRLGATADGLQLSDDWLRGSITGNDRIVRAIGADEALAVDRSMNAGRVEKWLVHIDPFGNATVALVDQSGKIIVQPTSRLLGGKP